MPPENIKLEMRRHLKLTKLTSHINALAYYIINSNNCQGSFSKIDKQFYIKIKAPQEYVNIQISSNRIYFNQIKSFIKNILQSFVNGGTMCLYQVVWQVF